MRSVRVKSVVRNVVEKADGTLQPFLGLEDLEGGTARLLAKELPLKGADDSICHRPGDVLFSKLRPYLAKSYLPQVSATGTGELLVLRPSPQVDPRYLLYVTLSAPWLEWATTTSYGTKMPRTSWELMGDYRFWLPSLQEQRRIADLLDIEVARLGHLRDAMQVQEGLLKQRRLHALDSVADDASSPSSRARLGYLVNLVTSGSRGWGDYVSDAGRFFFRSANLHSDRIDPKLANVTYVEIPESAAVEACRARIESGDVLIGITGANAGWVCHADHAVIGGYVSQHVCLVRPDPSRIDGEWLSLLIASPSVQDRLMGSQYGGTKTQLSLPDVREIRVPLLTVQQQTEVARSVSRQIAVLDRQRALRQRQLQVLAERRQALITAAVTGQFDVSTASGRNVTEGITV